MSSRASSILPTWIRRVKPPINFQLKLSAFLHIGPTIWIQKMSNTVPDTFSFSLCITEDAWLEILIFLPGLWLYSVRLLFPDPAAPTTHAPFLQEHLLGTAQGIICPRPKRRAVLRTKFLKDGKKKSHHFIFLVQTKWERHNAEVVFWTSSGWKDCSGSNERSHF